MRVILFDIDTLRADHMSCYGYGRNTTPNMDAIAEEGVRFDEYYCPNAPCLPSRASLITGQYGIHTGVVGHGGTAADLRPQGITRHFQDMYSSNGLFMQFRKAGLHTASVSTFAERHSSWWFNAGLNECYNVGKCGGELGNGVTEVALDWLTRNKDKDDWMLHIHYWDPHTPYRTPMSYGNPYENDPLPDNWITEEIFQEHLLHVGPHGANEIGMWTDHKPPMFPRHPGKVTTMAEMKEFMDNYDLGIKYTDDQVGKICDLLKEQGIYDDVCFIITADHGENIGELGLYAEHGTADEPTCHIPMIIKWKGGASGVVDKAFHDNTDLCPTVTELLNVTVDPGYRYDGKTYAATVMTGEEQGRENLVLSQCAHVCQRSARFGDYIYIRTVHAGGHLFDDEMLFNVKEDPHQLHNIVKERPDLAAQGAKIILDWVDSNMKVSIYDTDPMWTVMREGGPEHSRGEIGAYAQRLAGTARDYGVAALAEKYPDEMGGIPKKW